MRPKVTAGGWSVQENIWLVRYHAFVTFWFLKNLSKNRENNLEYRFRRTNSKNIALLWCRSEISKIFGLKRNLKKKSKNCAIVRFRKNCTKKWGRNVKEIFVEIFRNFHNGGYWKIFIVKNSSKNPQKILRYRSRRADSKNITFLRFWGKF